MLELRAIDDPRSPYKKLRRKECARLARLHGIDEIDPEMPATLQQKILQKYRVPVPEAVASRPLGQMGRKYSYDPERPTKTPADLTHNAPETDAEALLEAAWKKERPSLEDMPIGDLRKLCKERDIPLKRTDKRTDMVAKLNGQPT